MVDMFKAAYVTFDNLDPNSGAGTVCLHEIDALKKVADMAQVISRPDIVGLNHYPFTPFTADYFAARAYNGPEGVDLLHLSCAPGLALLDRIRPKHYVVNCPAHDLKISIDQHERYYGKGSYNFIHNTDPVLHELLLRHAKYADAVITPSTSSAKWIEENIKPQRIEVISHGCDIPATISPLPAEFRCGYLGTFGPDKALENLLMAWKFFTGKGKLVFGGNCKDGVLWLASQMGMMGNMGNYELTGWVKNISDFYNGISVYCQCSSSEGYGIETIEAMAHGRPVIVSSGAGSADAVTDGVDGFIVRPRDPQAILEKLELFYQNPTKVAEMGAMAREKAKKYEWSVIEARYIQFYKGILGQ